MRKLPEKSEEIVVAIHDLRQPNDVRCAIHQSEVSLLSDRHEDLQSVFATLAREVSGNVDPQWEAIDFEHARDSIELTLRFEMAYGVECVSESDASALASRFLEHFEGGRTFVAAYDLTSAMYQVTFIAISEKMAGILYIDDED
jgi:hypothetical protein